MNCRLCNTPAAPHELALKQGDGKHATGACLTCLEEMYLAYADTEAELNGLLEERQQLLRIASVKLRAAVKAAKRQKAKAERNCEKEVGG